MKILFYTLSSGLIASSRIRVHQYLPYFKKNNIKYNAVKNYLYLPYYFANCDFPEKLSCPGTSFYRVLCRIKALMVLAGRFINVIYSFIQVVRLALTAAIFSYDIVYVQKVLLPLSVVSLLKRLGKRMVFDFDDAIYIHKNLFKTEKLFDRLIPYYDLVITVNHEAESYIKSKGNSNTLVVTGPIETQRYKPVKTTGKDRVVIGWIGSFSTQENLLLLKNVFENICSRYDNVYVETIGAEPLDLGSARVIRKKWRLETEMEDLHDFDIGIMPLKDDDWSRGKGGYKLLQYMSAGIPCCASPVGINNLLIIEGINGFLATSEEEWLEKLSKLVENEELRKSMGLNGRRIALEKYSFDRYYPELEKKLLELHGSLS